MSKAPVSFVKPQTIYWSANTNAFGTTFQPCYVTNVGNSVMTTPIVRLEQVKENSKETMPIQPPKNFERKAIEYIQAQLKAHSTLTLQVVKAGWLVFQAALGSCENFLLSHPQFFRVSWGPADDATFIHSSLLPEDRQTTPAINTRRITNKILTLLCLSPTYSLEVDKLRQELGWDEPKQGNFHQFLCSMLKNDGKQLFGLTVAGGDYRVHLIKDIYLNAVSQKLRAYYDKHYKTSKELLTVEMMRRFLYWDCSTRQFKDFLVNHGMSKLLTPPTVQIVDGNSASDQPRHFRPQIVRTVTHLHSVLTFVKQQYNLVSVVCYGGTPLTEGQPRLSLMRLTQANKQVLLVDLIALVEEARRTYTGKVEEFDYRQADFVIQLKGLLSSEEIRKCVWDFKENVNIWLEDFGVVVRGLIDLFPVVNYFFPELLAKVSGDDDGFPCPRVVAETLAPQCWKAQDFFQSLPVRNWHVRPLTQPMVIRAAMIGVGALLDIRKGVRTELSSRVNEKMTQVSELYYANPSTAETMQNGKKGNLAKLLSPQYSPAVNVNESPRRGSSGAQSSDHNFLGTPVLQGFGEGFSDNFGNDAHDMMPSSDFLDDNTDNLDMNEFDISELLHQLDRQQRKQEQLFQKKIVSALSPLQESTSKPTTSGNGIPLASTMKSSSTSAGSDNVGNVGSDPGPSDLFDLHSKQNILTTTLSKCC